MGARSFRLCPNVQYDRILSRADYSEMIINYNADDRVRCCSTGKMYSTSPEFRTDVKRGLDEVS